MLSLGQAQQRYFGARLFENFEHVVQLSFGAALAKCAGEEADAEPSEDAVGTICPLRGGRWEMGDGRWHLSRCRSSEVRGHESVVSGQWSVVTKSFQVSGFTLHPSFFKGPQAASQ